MEKQYKNLRFFATLLCILNLELALCYGNAGQQYTRFNHVVNVQSFPSNANLPMANSYSVYNRHNTIRPPIAQNFPAPPVPQLQSIQSPYAVQGLLIKNYASGITGTPVLNAWTPNSNPNAPIYQQQSIQPALTSNSQTPPSNAQLVQYNGIGSNIRQNNGLLFKPTNVQQHTFNPVNNQFVPGNYVLQNRQPIVNQLGINANYLNNPIQQNANLGYPTSLPAYQTSNFLFTRNSNTLRSNPSLLQQAQLQQAQLQQLQLQQIQLQHSLAQTQKRLRQQQRGINLSFRPSPQLPSAAVLDGSQSVIGPTFHPVNTKITTYETNTLSTQEWVPLNENEEVKPTDAVKSSQEAKKKPKGKAIVQVEPEVKISTSSTKNVTKTSTKNVTTAIPKTELFETKDQTTTSITTKETIATPKTKAAETLNIVAETVATGVAASDEGTGKPVVETANNASDSSGSSDQVDNKEPQGLVPSEPLVLAVAEPAFLDLIKETSETPEETI